VSHKITAIKSIAIIINPSLLNPGGGGRKSEAMTIKRDMRVIKYFFILKKRVCWNKNILEITVSAGDKENGDGENEINILLENEKE